VGEVHRTPIGEMWIDEEGVLWHRLAPGAVVTAEAAAEVLATTKRLAGGRRVPVVVDIRGVAFADRESRDAFAGADAGETELATAILVDKGFSARLATLFVRFSNPSRPTRVFTSETEARSWLRETTGPLR
jgi:hypothetical protein